MCFVYVLGFVVLVLLSLRLLFPTEAVFCWGERTGKVIRSNFSVQQFRETALSHYPVNGVGVGEERRVFVV